MQAARIVKLPVFYKTDIGFWFTQIKVAFKISGITREQTKFEYVIHHADPEFLPLIVPIARDPPRVNLYQAIKSRIIKAFEESEETRLRRLLQRHNVEKILHSIYRTYVASSVQALVQP